MMGILKRASAVRELPVVKWISPASPPKVSELDLAGFLKAQRLAYQAAKEIGSMIQEGWTERETARLLNTYLRDHGVKNFFHEAFVWFGERTRFEGVRSYAQYGPSDRRVLPGEVMILDVAPVVEGYVCDIGHTLSLGENSQWKSAQKFLQDLRGEIPQLFCELSSGAQIWERIDQRIKAGGYDNIHKKYPFSVLGHRVHRVPEGLAVLKWWNFGWQSYWSLLSRGLFGQLLNGDFEGDLKGLWAVEPHIGAENFGAKFEELLLVEEHGARWIEGEGNV